MPVDIFPQVGDPAIYVAQPYGGMDPAQMEGYLTYYYEYHFLYITGIDHVESKSIQGAALMKLVFHQGTNMSQAMAETVGYVNRARAFMPPGTVPPFITRFDAGSVAVGQLVFSSATRTQGEMQDFALNRVRPLFATLPGVSAPPPFGGNQRTIVVTLDPDKLRQYRISPDEAIAAVSKASLVMPSGNMWTGKINRIARTNAALGGNLSELLEHAHPSRLRHHRLPARHRDHRERHGPHHRLRPRQREAHRLHPGHQARGRLDAGRDQRGEGGHPEFRKVVPEDVDVRLEFDQSPYVTNSIRGLVIEGLLGASLTGLMVLMFLRDWRSALIVVMNIPFALLSAVVLLWVTGQTINIMTLGGLALAVGVLVDEATVEIENIHTQMLPGRFARPCGGGGVQPDRHGAPALDVLHPGRVRAVVLHGRRGPAAVRAALAGGRLRDDRVLSALQQPGAGVFDMADEGSPPRRGAGGTASGACAAFYATISDAWCCVFAGRWSSAIWPLPSDSFTSCCRAWGRRSFPTADAPAAAAPAAGAGGNASGGDGADRASRAGRHPPRSRPGQRRDHQRLRRRGALQLSGESDPPVHQRAAGSGDSGGAQARNPTRRSAAGDAARRPCAANCPDRQFSFEAGDIVSQVMGFGSPTPVEVAVQGISLQDDYAYAQKVRAQLAKLPFLRDLQFAQEVNYPTLDINIDRDRAGQFGLTMADVVRSVVPATSSSRFTQPNYWRDPNSGNAFQIQVQLPQNRMQSMDEIGDLPVMQNGRLEPSLLTSRR